MTIYDFPQYSDDWWRIRRGVPTSSETSSILTPKKMQLSAAADGYICRLLGDLYDPEYPRLDGPITRAMERGHAQEDESRRWYEMERNVTARKVGFIVSDCGRFGSSPDSIIDGEGLLELKNPSPHTHIAYLLAGTLPDEYRCQVHDQLLVSGLKYVDWVSYCPGMPAHLIVRVTRDLFTETLLAAKEQFWVRYCELKRKLEAM